MFYFILVLLILDALILAAVILLQAGQGGGLASLGGSGSTDTVMKPHMKNNVVTVANPARMPWLLEFIWPLGKVSKRKKF